MLLDPDAAAESSVAVDPPSPPPASPPPGEVAEAGEPVRHAAAPMWAAAGLLALETLALALLLSSRLEASGVLAQAAPRSFEMFLSRGLHVLTRSGDDLVAALGLLPAAVMAGVAAPLMIVARRGGWLLAMLAQALLLVVCLARYAADTEGVPRFIFPVLAYAVLTVLYLNARHVRAAVYDRPAGPMPDEQAEAPLLPAVEDGP
jgi:hypothetical protein